MANSSGPTAGPWPTADAYAAAIQMPRFSFPSAELKNSTFAMNRLGLPVVISGNFAYVFKVLLPNGGAQAIRCFRQHVGDRESRYKAINQHLDAHNLSYAAAFEYDSGGIVVNGRPFPILVMEWIEGNTLDVYVGEVLKTGSRKSSLTSLAREWVRVVDDLQRAGVAHGDIQHGNIMFTSGGLRLVDLDGMFVPTLAGRPATEIGHRHFQHPKRIDTHFDATVDHFPALVVYLSILALAEEPALWDKYHDDNLLFTKSDFQAPERSPLIAALRRNNGDVRRLTEILVKATNGNLRDVPPLNSLVSPPKLPAWIMDPIVPTVPTKTMEVRETAPTYSPPAPLASVTASPGTPAYSTPTFPVPTPPVVVVPAVPPPGASWMGSILPTTIQVGLFGVLGAFIWYPLLGSLVDALFGLSKSDSYRPAAIIAAYAVVMTGVATWLSWQSRGRFTRPGAVPLSTLQPVSTSGTSSGLCPLHGIPCSPHHYPASYSPPAPPRPSPTPRVLIQVPSGSRTGGSGPVVVASRLRTTYHEPSCRWAYKISPRNRISFASASEARLRGLTPCGECRP
jgi:hypothetical protein